MSRDGALRRAGLEPTLPSAYYRDPEILERELERVFCRSWLCAGRADRIPEPGDYFTLQLGPESVLLVRDKEGIPRAFYNVCRHRGSALCAEETGRFKGAIRCPYHAWTYALDGTLIGTPNLRDGDGFSREDYPLYPIGLEVWAGFLFIRLDRGGEPLAAQLEEMPGRVRRYPLADLRVGHRAVHEVEANWKILVENYMECYHCPGIHPELCDLVPLYRRGLVDAPDAESAYFRDGAVTFTLTGTTRRPLLAGLSEEEKRRYSGELVLPNMFLNLFPDYAHTRNLWPLSPSRTRIYSEWLFEPDTMARQDFDPSDAVEFLDLVGWQDWRVCEAVQRGMASRAHRHGVYTPQEEYAAGFKRWLLGRLEAG